ncbi:metalloprotease family M12A [Achlya hypogyna]|uniref:Metalloendopeptidase n=1 Tax=Achlya hypogyna TaxID=1202772 RepID=A0A1V9YGY5_ACHHY|nr:metalloprotease family M12A [Achlya hypogyna]
MDLVFRLLYWLAVAWVGRTPTTTCLVPLGAVTNPLSPAYMTQGQLQYIVGRPQEAGAIYRVCDTGSLTCYEENGTADGPVDKVVDCAAVGTIRRLGLATDRKRRLWPKAVLCYVISDSLGAAEHALIDAAMHEIQTTTGLAMVELNACATHRLHDQICGGCEHFVSIEQERDHHGTFAEIGYRGIAGQKLNLMPAAFTAGKGTIMHELLHAFGVIHEHAHPAAEAVVLRGRGQMLSAALSNYVPVKEALVTQYNVDSIMHYGHGLCLPKSRGVKYCAIDQNESDGCVVPTEDDCDIDASKVLGQRLKLSKGDIRNVQLLYGLPTTVSRQEVQDVARRHRLRSSTK